MARGTSPQPPPKSHLSRTNPPTSSAASKPIPHPIPHPTTLLTSSFARTYTHLHPILILTLFTARFSATVRDPIHSLTTLLIPLALLQFTYCILCIPASDTPTPRKRSKGLATLKRRAFVRLFLRSDASANTHSPPSSVLFSPCSSHRSPSPRCSSYTARR